MGSPVVHFEIRSTDPDASRAFYGKLFDFVGVILTAVVPFAGVALRVLIGKNTAHSIKYLTRNIVLAGY